MSRGRRQISENLLQHNFTHHKFHGEYFEFGTCVKVDGRHSLLKVISLYLFYSRLVPKLHCTEYITVRSGTSLACTCLDITVKSRSKFYKYLMNPPQKKCPGNC